MSQVERARHAVVWISVVLQLLFGVIGFFASPQTVFSGIEDMPLALLCLRLAVYSNLAQVVVAVYLLSFSSGVTPVRVLAGSLVVYHVLAGIDGARVAAGLLPVALAGPVFGPAVFHSVSAVFLGLAAAWPARNIPIKNL